MSYNQSLDYAADIEPQMRGQWQAFIANEIGFEPITEGRGKGKGHECPICGGKDRAHFKEKDGRVFLFCRGACGNKNSTWGSNTCSTPEYVCMTVRGYDFPTLVERCADWLGVDRPTVKRDNRQNKPVKSELTPLPEHRETRQSTDHTQGSAASWISAEQYASRKNPIDAILSCSIVTPWNRIGYCLKNSITGDSGEFYAVINNDGELDLIIPVSLTAGGRVVVVGCVQVSADGLITKHGSCDGAYATIVSNPHALDKEFGAIFCTDYAIAWRLSRKCNAKCYYATNPRTIEKTDAKHVYINTTDIELIDKACATYKQRVGYIMPTAIRRDCVPDSFEFTSYQALQELVKSHEEHEEREGYEKGELTA